jgi:hypothetical protein
MPGSMRDSLAMDQRGTSVLTDGELAGELTAEDVALLERADAIRFLIERYRPTRDERLDLLAWVVWPTKGVPFVVPTRQVLAEG